MNKIHNKYTTPELKKKNPEGEKDSPEPITFFLFVRKSQAQLRTKKEDQE